MNFKTNLVIDDLTQLDNLNTNFAPYSGGNGPIILVILKFRLYLRYGM
jgi:hypothetical protein